MLNITWKNKSPYLTIITPSKLHSAGKRFNWESIHPQPQAYCGLSLALILLHNVLLTSCIAENQLTSAAIAECRKTSGHSPGHLICPRTDKNYALLVELLFFFSLTLSGNTNSDELQCFFCNHSMWYLCLTFILVWRKCVNVREKAAKIPPWIQCTVSLT